MKLNKPTRLYIKIHEITGLKYFGKSVKENLENYHGSGKKWKRHIKKHGIQHVRNLWISEWYYFDEDIKQVCANFCRENNIVESDEWANLKEENGLDGGSPPDYALKSIKQKLTGRSKETHQYILDSAMKKSKTMKEPGSVYQTQARPKIQQWLNNLTKDERKNLFGHTMSEENRQKQSRERKNQTKDTCERVRKMSETKKHRIQNMSEMERKQHLGHSRGMRWYHNDSLRLCKTMHIEDVTSDWILGRKKYEDNKN